MARGRCQGGKSVGSRGGAGAIAVGGAGSGGHGTGPLHTSPQEPLAAERRPKLWSPLLVVRVADEPRLAVVGLLPELPEPSPSISSGAIALCVFQRKKPKRLQMNTDSCW